jgi:hypothetical protein
VLYNAKVYQNMINSVSALCFRATGRITERGRLGNEHIGY